MAAITELFDELFEPNVAMQFFYAEDTGISRPAFELDCVPTESFNGSTQYTKLPIQAGSDITDHAIHNPITLSISFIVSNFPVRIEEVPLSIGAGVVGGLSDSIFAKLAMSEAIVKLREEMDPEGFMRSKKAFEKIEEIRLKSVPLQILSKRKEYQNMCITSFSVTDDKDTQHSLIGTISFEEKKFIEISKVILTTPQKSIDKDVRASAVGESNVGKKSTKTITGGKANKASSWLFKLYN